MDVVRIGAQGISGAEEPFQQSLPVDQTQQEPAADVKRGDAPVRPVICPMPPTTGGTDLSAWETGQALIAADGGPATLLGPDGMQLSIHNGEVTLFDRQDAPGRTLDDADKQALADALQRQIDAGGAGVDPADLKYALAELRSSSPPAGMGLDGWSTASVAIAADGGPVYIAGPMGSITIHNGSADLANPAGWGPRQVPLDKAAKEALGRALTGQISVGGNGVPLDELQYALSELGV